MGYKNTDDKKPAQTPFFSKAGLLKISKAASGVLFLLALPLVLYLYNSVNKALLDKEAEDISKQTLSYAMSVSDEIASSTQAMDMAGALIADDKLSTTDAYAMLSSTDQRASWRIYTKPVSDKTISGAKTYIENDGQLVTETCRIKENKVCIVIVKQGYPVSLIDAPEGIYLVDTVTNRSAGADRTTAAAKTYPVTDSTFMPYPDTKRIRGEDICYFESEIANTMINIRQYTSIETLKDRYADISGKMKKLIIAVLALIIYVCFNIFLESGRVSRSDAIKQEKEAAEKANSAKNLFLANMSHEIRTPINSILGLNEIILRESSEPAIKEYAGNIKTAGANLLSLINDVLDFSRIEQGSMTLIDKPYSLSRVLKELYTVFNYRASEKRLRFDFSIDESIPEHLSGDSIRVEQVFSNLLSNAIKYTDNGKVSFTLTWRESDDATAELIARVEDTGRGMKEDSIPVIFNKFTRVDMLTNNSIEGTGLGLAITKEIVDAMGGEISVESVYGSGSVFTVKLPQGIHLMKPIGKFNPIPESNSDIDSSAPYIPDAKLLIVDDTEMNLIVTKKLLEPTSAVIDTVSSGLECISKTEINTYDIIFMDDRMPQLDGTQTLKKMLSEDRIRQKLMSGNTKVIMMTANVVSGAKENYVSDGFTDYLPKPVSPMVLFNTVRTYINPALIKERPVTTSPQTESSDMDERSRLSAIPELNVDTGIANCGGFDTYLDALQNFSETAGDLINEISGYLKADDIENATIKFHATKSTARLLGDMELSETARALEEAGNNGDVRYIQEHAGGCLQSMGKLSVAIKTALINESDWTVKKEEIDFVSSKGIFDHMYEYAEDFNDEALLSMTRALKDYRFAEPYDSAFKHISKYLKKADWEGVHSVFKNLGYTES